MDGSARFLRALAVHEGPEHVFVEGTRFDADSLELRFSESVPEEIQAAASEAWKRSYRAKIARSLNASALQSIMWQVADLRSRLQMVEVNLANARNRGDAKAAAAQESLRASMATTLAELMKEQEGYASASYDDAQPSTRDLLISLFLTVVRGYATPMTKFGEHVWALDGNLYQLPAFVHSSDDARVLIEHSVLKQAVAERDILERARRELDALRRVADQVGEPEYDRQPIPRDAQMFVWRRDQGQCVQCGSREHLEFDHIIPISKGGANTTRNIQLLCQDCNRQKSDAI